MKRKGSILHGIFIQTVKGEEAMRVLIGFWIVCVAITSCISLLLYAAELKEKFFMILGISVFIGALEVGIYFMS